MMLTAGTRVGPKEIESPLGIGGMGTLVVGHPSSVVSQGAHVWH